MRDFLKDQLSWILFFYAQLALILIVVQLATSLNGTKLDSENLLYIVLLTTVFLTIFLGLRYYRWKELYHFTNEKPQKSTWMPDTPNQLTSKMSDHFQKQYEDYKHQLEQLEEKRKLESSFMQQWIHQMKTPLSVLRLILEKDRHHFPNDIHRNIEEELDRIKHGLEIALYQARMQQFERDFHVDQVALRELVLEAIQTFKSSFIRNQVYPVISIDSSLYVYTDTKWMLFVLHQLINNAIKYAAQTNTKINFSARYDTSTVALQIEDQGVGIPKEDLNRVFDPFFTGQNGRRFQESTGMGLYLVKQICTELGHNIKITSENRQGTKVTLTFSNLTKM